MPIRVSMGITQNAADDRYVNVTGDTMTGKLVITPTTDTKSIEVHEHAYIEQGKRLYFDEEVG